MPDRLLRQYAAVFFFAPLVQRRLDGHDFGLSQGDKNIIKHSISWGYVSFALGVMFLVVSILEMTVGWTGLMWIYRSLMGITLLSLLIGVWRIHHPHDTTSSSTTLITNHMLTAFIPGYNRYLWYTEQDPHHPYRWLKESILWRYVIVVCLFLPYMSSIGFMLIALMVSRIILLAAGYDIISSQHKKKINRLFVFHVDEIWSYISASIEMLWIKKPYQALVTQYKHYYRRKLPLHPSTWHTTDIIGYIIYGLICILIIWGGRQVRDTTITAPTVFWGAGGLIIYHVIRHHYGGGRRPAPIIQPLIDRAAAYIIQHTAHDRS